MSVNCTLALALLIALLAQGISGAAVRKHTKDTFSEHINRVGKFRCKTPQPRAVRSSDLLTKTKLSSYEEIVPSMTVLNKCDEGSGCCLQGTCMPDEDEVVTLEFKIVNMMTGDMRDAFVTTLNHTKCVCSDGGNYLPK